MSGLYKDLTDYLPRINDIEFGKWYPEKQKGTRMANSAAIQV